MYVPKYKRMIIILVCLIKIINRLKLRFQKGVSAKQDFPEFLTTRNCNQENKVVEV